jgi:uncharacterized Tic20 family protein
VFFESFVVNLFPSLADPRPLIATSPHILYHSLASNRGTTMSDENYSTSVPDKEARMWATVCHLSAFGAFLLPFFGNIIIPLVVWLLKRESHPFVDDQGREVLNFQITITLLLFAGVLLCFVLIGFLLLPALGIYAVIMTIIGAIRANEGVAYRYPFTLRLL